MTRDTTRSHDDRNQANMSAYEALWAIAPFPYLPEDAPPELRKLTIDIEDPRRVYTIHKAARRHNFQLLLDRFIHQIRYGCTYKACNVPTCFSCRKRLANGAPVRRYNATSARTLAFYMMSTDNPEKALCFHTPEVRPPSKNTSIKTKNLPLGDNNELPAKGHVKAKSSTAAPAVKSSFISRQGLSTEDAWNEEIEAKLATMGETTTTDHRSFVQNLFETVTFRMTEWLTPRYLDSLVGSHNSMESSPAAGISLTSENISDSSKPQGESIDPENKKNQSEKGCETKDSRFVQKNGTDVKSVLPHTDSRSSDDAISRRENPSSSEQPSAFDDSKSEPEKSLHIDITNDRPVSTNYSPVSEEISPKKVPTRSSQIPLVDIRGQGDMPIPLSSTPQVTKIQFTSRNWNLAEEVETDQSKKECISPMSRENPLEASLKEVDRLPQSLGAFTIEIIEFMCSTLQRDGTCEKHNLHPQNISETLKQNLLISHSRNRLRRNPSFQNKIFYPNSGRQRWKAFIEQSFFNVLGQSVSLLHTFSDEDKKLVDSQTIWYLMLQMTRVAPTIVFNCLWDVAGELFKPPIRLENVCQLDKDFSFQGSSSKRALSGLDAARIVNICLHALIAASPLVEDFRQFGYISQIRSFGRALVPYENTPEAVTLCLQYEDIFTDTLAIRLARRLFAAIPSRRKFSELLKFQDSQNSEKQEPDILETILNTFEFFQPSNQPILVFSEINQTIHKERVPSLILDWARAVMLHDWNRSAVVSSDGPFGGALATIAAIHKYRNSLLIENVHFRTIYFADHLDPIRMPIEWLTFSSNKNTIHLLDHPYLFSPSTLITYFRTINYSKMNLAYEAAKSEYCRMSSTMHENSLMVDRYSREKLQERLRTATTKFMVMEIRRTHVLLDTFNSIWRREKRELMRPLKLRLGEESGEEGSDSGGVQQEYLRLAISEALNPDYGTFTVDCRTKMTWFQPGSPEPLWKFELIGMILSLAVYNGLTLPVTFPKALYKKLLGEEVTELNHIADGWPDLVNGLTTLLEWNEKDGLVEEVFSRTYEFSVEQFGKPVTCEMKDVQDGTATWPQLSDLDKNDSSTNAPLVTKENRESYVSDYIRYLTDISIRPQFTAFKNGFFTCISRRSISLFDAMTLQSVVEGIQEINISELRDTTRYIGWDGIDGHPTIEYFWSVVMEYDAAMKRKLLEFVTASDRVPVGGMCGLQFTIQKNGTEDRLLPTSYTCYGILLLPEYSNREVLQRQLAMALENSKGFGFA
ncbi:hypothetical protein K3495_g3569 [Podosphaera aphanis]|nr:hypothetical protein K3495_g3569 [Podosphaera aphanis]